MFIFVNKLIETREVCAAYLCEKSHWSKGGCALHIYVNKLTGTRQDACCISM